MSSGGFSRSSFLPTYKKITDRFAETLLQQNLDLSEEGIKTAFKFSNCVSFFSCLLPICNGNGNAVLLLSHAIYWSLISHEKGWFFHYSKQWRDATGLSWKQQKKVRKMLIEWGFLEEDAKTCRETYFGGDKRDVPTIYFRVNFNEIAQQLCAVGKWRRIELTKGKPGSAAPDWTDDEELED